jgi:hypothetical protein
MRATDSEGSPCDRFWEWIDEKGFKTRSQLEAWLEENPDAAWNDHAEECAENYPFEEDTFTVQDVYKENPDRPRSSLRRELQELVKQGKLERIEKGIYKALDLTPLTPKTKRASLFNRIIDFIKRF